MEGAGEYYHAHHTKIELITEGAFYGVEAAMFMTALVITPFFPPAGAAVAVAAGTVKMVHIGVSVAFIAADVIDANQDWENSEITVPQYAIDIEVAKNELILINNAQDMRSLSFALGIDYDEMDITNEDALNDMANQITLMENSTGRNLQGIIEQSRFTSDMNDNLAFYTRQNIEITNKSISIFNNVKIMYSEMTPHNQNVFIKNYLFKKKSNYDTLIDKSFDEILNDGTFDNIREYVNCLYIHDGIINYETSLCLNDDYMAMFLRFKKDEPKIFTTPLELLIQKIYGDIYTNEYNYRRMTVIPILIVLFIIFIVIFIVILIVWISQKKKPSLNDNFERLKQTYQTYQPSLFNKFISPTTTTTTIPS